MRRLRHRGPRRRPLGAPRERRRDRLRRLLSAALPGWPRRFLYAVLSVPLGAAGAALFAGLVTAVVLAWQGIGVVLFLVVLAAARGLGGLERHLARTLLGLQIAPDKRVRRQPGRLRQLRMLVIDSSTWRTLGWLGARVLLGAGILATLVFGCAGVVLLLTEAEWNPLSALPLLGLLAVVLLAAVVALDLQVRLAALIAPRLLGVAIEEKLAALRRASQRLADRNRLARDLHDTIGHSLTASLLQAGAARRTLLPSPDPAAPPVDLQFARQALEHIETNTRTALAELDRALAVLRDEAVGEAPAPALRQGGAATSSAAAADLSCLEGLLAGLRDGGLPVTLDVAVPLDQVPDELSELGYRVVQEGTTNVLRHAGCPPTTVLVARIGDTLTVVVRNGPWSGRDSRPGPGGGRGLEGLRVRAESVGGLLASGPTRDGGFELCVALPLPSAA